MTNEMTRADHLVQYSQLYHGRVSLVQARHLSAKVRSPQTVQKKSHVSLTFAVSIRLPNAPGLLVELNRFWNLVRVRPSQVMPHRDHLI